MQLFEHYESKYNLMLAASEKAIIKAEIASERRFEGVNEFRAQLADQQATLARKAEVNIRFEALEKKLDTAVTQLQQSKGRETGVNLVATIVAFDC